MKRVVGLLVLVLLGPLALSGAAPARAADRSITSSDIDPGYAAGRAWADVTGDHRADYCRIVGNPGAYGVQCLVSTGDGFGAELQSPVIDVGAEAERAWVDADGNGTADFCRMIGGPRVACLLSRPGGGFGGGELTSPVIDPGYAGTRFWADYDADGGVDFCRLVGEADTNERVSCTTATAARFDTSVVSDALDWGAAEGRAFTDVNGDDRADYCRVIGTQVACTYATASATGFGSTITSHAIDAGYAFGRAWADVDGNGRSDFCRFVGESTTNERVSCLLATPAGFGASPISPVIGWGATPDWADFDGDTRADYCRVVGSEASNQRAACVLSKHEGFSPAGASEPLVSGATEGRRFADVTGDGRADFCRLVGVAPSQVTCTISNGSSFAGPVDRDRDGFQAPQDCDDDRPDVRPGASDVPDNAVDEDCSGADAVDLDRDRDGVTRPSDCDDANAGIRPGAADVPVNGVDEDCDGSDTPLSPVRATVTLRWSFAGSATVFTAFRVGELRAGTRVAITCRGRGCPSPATLRRANRRSRGVVNLLKAFRGRRLVAGVRVTVRITRPATLGQVYEIRTRRRRAPLTKRRCLTPGRVRATVCPA